VIRRRSQRPSRKRSRSARSLILEQAERILTEALEREREYQRLGMVTVTISREELVRKLTRRGTHSPFLTQISRSNAVRGTTFLMNFGVMNPDPWPYDEMNLGLCYCWSDAGGITDPGSTLLRADPALGVRQVAIGVLNAAAMPYSLSTLCDIPSSFRLGPADVNWFLYQPNVFDIGILLSRGTMRVVVT
jgi:hypothetical protein